MKIKIYKNGGAVVFDPNTTNHMIDIDSEVVDEVDDTEENRGKYLGIKPEKKTKKMAGQKIKTV